ncbi:MAG: hypothetical protein H0U75_02865 [Legionella sp.]|nr:hypothetical protein [Legionella sp.]
MKNSKVYLFKMLLVSFMLTLGFAARATCTCTCYNDGFNTLKSQSGVTKGECETLCIGSQYTFECKAERL